jgi:hypothetical protein
MTAPWVFTCEPVQLPRNELPPVELDPDIAYQVVHDELMLDGNARLNLATFVTTWMEPQATRLMTECFDKNMIDKDEYPRTADRGPGAAVRTDARPALARPASPRSHRLLDHRLQRGVHAGRAGA